MKRIAKIPALVAVVLLTAVGVTGALAGPGGLLTGSASDSPPAASEASAPNDDRSGAALHAEDEANDEDPGGIEIKGDPIDCPSGEDTQFKFEQEGDKFEVTGLLVSLDATSVTVTGPQGDVVAALDPAAEIKGPPAGGEPVKVEGSVLADGSFLAREIEPACEAEGVNDDADDGTEVKGDPIDCPSGEDTQFKFEQEGDEFEVTGLLVSLDAASVTVTGPQGDVVAALDPAAEIKGPPAAGDPVKVEGSVLADSSFLAREIEPACEADDEGDQGDDADQDEADDDQGHVDDDHGDADDVEDGDQGHVDDDHADTDDVDDGDQGHVDDDHADTDDVEDGDQGDEDS